MRTGSVVLALALVFRATPASAGNDDSVIAGTDVALTGGAVVANVNTGGALWYNPAGVARLDNMSVGLTGAVLSYTLVSAPGTLSLTSGEQSKGDFSAVQAIPRALTFVAAPRPNLRWGVGFFFSRILDRFVQDTVASDAGASPSAEWFGSGDETKSIYHISSSVAWKQSERFLLGGGLDIVIASTRASEIVSGGYDAGASGTGSRTFAQALSGGGLQAKIGLQWAPVEEVRVGWMIATPTYLVYLDEEATLTETRSSPGGPSEFNASQIDELNGAWAGAEPGLTRLGVAYLRHWGWIEADLVVQFPLKTPALEIDWKTVANARLGGIFNLTSHLKLGVGFFTDFSPERSLDNFADDKVNFYGFTFGFDYANRPEPPEKDEKGFYLAFAVAVRYSHGSGTTGGLLFPSVAPPASEPLFELQPIPIKINEMGINLAIKTLF